MFSYCLLLCQVALKKIKMFPCICKQCLNDCFRQDWTVDANSNKLDTTPSRLQSKRRIISDNRRQVIVFIKINKRHRPLSPVIKKRMTFLVPLYDIERNIYILNYLYHHYIYSCKITCLRQYQCYYTVAMFILLLQRLSML